MTQDANTNTASGAAEQPDALIERLEDAVYEWGNYVDEDHAPRPLTRHVDPHIKAIAAELQRLRAARAPADPQLLKFYGVTTDAELIAAQARHIERMQAKLPQTQSFAPQRVREG